MNQRKKEPFGVNIGTSSLLLVFVILCLVSFATLSTVSATADKKLNDKMLERTQSYYNASNEAQIKLSEIDATLANIYEQSSGRDEYIELAGDVIDFAIPVSEVQTLNVRVDVTYPSKKGDSFYTITKWKLETTGTLEEDESLKLLF